MISLKDYQAYRRERHEIRRLLSEDNRNFW